MNSFKLVQIGNQIWMAENLDVDKFQNGDSIPHAISDEDWEKAGDEGKPAWCYYKNDPANGKKYGKLYNWHAVNDPRGLAPKDWHVPTDKEWSELTDYLGGEGVAGGKLKETGAGHWAWPNQGATNESRFSALPGGSRGTNGTFYSIGNFGDWWSATESSTYHAWGRALDYYTSIVGRIDCGDKEDGFSVRCLRD